MKFYTIQDPDVLSLLNNDKWITTKQYYTFPDYYIWMIHQMKNRLTIKNPSDSIIWLWKDKPDLRCSGYGVRGKELVLIELELDADTVIASDFIAWHYVLNAIILDEDSDCTSISIEESWNRIFDLEYCKTLWEEDHKQIIQYTTGEIDTTKVKLIKKFICK